MAILEAKDISSGYGEVQILWGASLSLKEGKLTSLVGANGVGKTTLLRTVVGLNKPWEGSVWFEGEDVSKLSAHAKANLGLVLVPEGRQLFTDMTIFENLEMGATAKRARSKMNESLEKVYTMFPRLKERRSQKSGTLSGGEQQRVALARALAHNPKIILADEPTGNLDEDNKRIVFELLRDVNRQNECTIIIATHDIELASKYVSRAVKIQNKKFVEWC